MNEFRLFQVTRTPHETGVFCSLRLEEAEMPAIVGAWSVLSAFTLWLIPFYDRSLGYRVTYDLFIDAKLRKRYQYQVSGKMINWAAAVFVMPFLSGTWHVELDPLHRVNDDLLKGLWQTSKMFWEDARNDGYLQ